MIVQRAIYRGGERVADVPDVAAMAEVCRDGGGIAWIGLNRPTAEEFAEVTCEFELHELAVEDAIKAHQRPKLERYGDTLFIVLRAAHYLDETETVEFGEVAIFVGPQFVITVRHSDAPELGSVRRRLEARPDLLRLGTMAIMYAIVDHVVDGYEPVVAGLENDIDEIEDEVFTGSPTVSRRIYQLTREVIEFQRDRAARRHPRAPDRRPRDRRGRGPVPARCPGPFDPGEGTSRRVPAPLQNILSVNPQPPQTKALTEASHAQNEQVKRISAWAAILFAPTLIGTNYGMNFDHMPSFTGPWGIRSRSGLMVLVSTCLYLVFRRRGWI